MSWKSTVVVMAAKLVAAYEARSSSNHSSPTNATRDVPLYGTAGKKAKRYVLVSIFLDKDGEEAKSETTVEHDQMTYIGDRPDETSSDITWSYYKFAGNDVRLSGEYFLYSIRGNYFYCRHKLLMPEYRKHWMSNGHQRLKRRPPPCR